MAAALGDAAGPHRKPIGTDQRGGDTYWPSAGRRRELEAPATLADALALQPAMRNPQDEGTGSFPLKRHGHVVVLTKDGRTHDFNVTSVSASTIEGRHESISIAQIVFIKKRQLSVEKTALAVGMAIVIAAAAAPAPRTAPGQSASKVQRTERRE